MRNKEDNSQTLRKWIREFEYWRPIGEIYKGYGSCIVVNLILDPCHLELHSCLEAGFNESDWTHFVPVPQLTVEDAERMIDELGPEKQ